MLKGSGDFLLIKPNASLVEEISSYRQEFLDSGDSMDGCGSLRRHDDPLDWLAFCRQLECPETVPENWVPSSQYVAFRPSDGRILGMIDIRHRFNGFLEKFGGNIGYSVRPSERRKGYATRMLHEALAICWELGLKRVLITCLEENEGSRRTILANGGTYESTVFEPQNGVHLERYWIIL